MGSGLLAGYGSFTAIAGSFLYPAGGAPTGWMFVAEVARLESGDALVYRTPSGATVSITRQADAGDAGDFVALSTVCPHLGCQVHWEAANDRFFCPCHNGVFDRDGKGTGGPPGDAGQALPRYPLRVEGGLLFIEVPTPRRAAADATGAVDAPEPRGTLIAHRRADGSLVPTTSSRTRAV